MDMVEERYKPCRWWILPPAGWNWWPSLVGAIL